MLLFYYSSSFFFFFIIVSLKIEKKNFYVALLIEFRELNHRCSIAKHDDDRIIRGRVIHSKF